MAKSRASQTSKKEDDSKLFAFLGIFLTVIGFLIVFVVRRNDKYAMHYGKQGLVLFIASIVVIIFAAIPVIGWALGWVVWVLWFVLWIIGLVYSLSGKIKEVPVIGVFANKFDL